MNRADRRALARKQRHHGRVTGKRLPPPRATIEYRDPDGNVVKTETVEGVDDPDGYAQSRIAESQRQDAETRRARAASMGLWLPGQPL